MRGSLGWTKTVGGCRIVWAVLGSPQCWSSGSVGSSFLQKQGKQGGSARAWPVAAPMLKSDSFIERKERMLRLAFRSVFFLLRTFHRWVGHVFIVYIAPNLRVARILSYWMRYFLPLSKEISKENRY